MFWSTVAQAQTAAAPQPGPSFLENLVWYIPIFVIFYFFLIRPQSRKQQKHEDFLKTMKRGDSVLTSAGILGTIEGITEKFVTLEVSDGVRIRVLKSAIASSAQEGQA